MAVDECLVNLGWHSTHKYFKKVKNLQLRIQFKLSPLGIEPKMFALHCDALATLL